MMPQYSRRTVEELLASTRLEDLRAGLNLLKTICDRVLGRDEHYDWDRAYVVRREAEEALSYL
ncbi:MAG: hypothetical protein ABSC02_07635 [Acidobacteriota bacterium]